MDVQLLKTVGQIAGIGGLAVCVFLLLFKDLLKKILAPRMSPKQWFRVVIVFMLLVWSLVLAVVIVSLWLNPGSNGAVPKEKEPSREPAKAPAKAPTKEPAIEKFPPSLLSPESNASVPKMTEPAIVNTIEKASPPAGQTIVNASNIGVVNTGPGPVYVNNYGYSKEEYMSLATNLAMTQSALDEFFRTIGLSNVPPNSVREELQTFAKQYKELKDRILSAPVSKPEEIKTKSEAIIALERGDLAIANELASRLPKRIKPPANLRNVPP